MDYQKELILFLEHFAPNQSQDVLDAVELDASFHVLKVPKLLAVKELSENYVFRLKDSWNAWKTAKAQAVPEGFVLVPKEPTDKTIAHMINTPIEVNLLCDHADTFLSEGEAYIAYKAMIEAQEQKG